MSRIRVRAFWPVAVKASAASVVVETTTLMSDARIEAGDFATATPANAGAAALEGNAIGVFLTVAAGQVTITHAAAAGGEIWHVAVYPANMSEF